MPAPSPMFRAQDRLARQVVLGVNLKMYFDYAQTIHWIEEIRGVIGARPRAAHNARIFVLPSSPMLKTAVAMLSGSGVAVGAQDVSSDDSGAHTGEVAASVVRQLGCAYALVGHAERRQRFAETDAQIAQKLAIALSNGLHPILCVGESANDRLNALAICTAQVDAALQDVTLHRPITVAYEPVWSIGASSPAPLEHIKSVCVGIREYLRSVRPGVNDRIIYGGTAGPGLLSDLHTSVDGLFLGRRVHDAGALGAMLDEVAEVVHNCVRPAVPSDPGTDARSAPQTVNVSTHDRATDGTP
jgi:triosephosphate isomerase (TIM)